MTADDVTEGKPHPEGYRSAAAQLGLPPDQTVVLEDATAGVLAARAAGVSAVIGVGARALESDADVVVADLTAVSWTGQGLLIAAAGLLRGPGRDVDVDRSRLMVFDCDPGRLSRRGNGYRRLEPARRPRARWWPSAITWPIPMS